MDVIRRDFKPSNGQHVEAETFNPQISYENYLRVFRQDFKSKWETTPVSPSTGLKGFTVIRMLGMGSFGKVKLVKNNLNGKLYAAKVVPKRRLISPQHIAAIYNEKRILYSIKFPFHTSLEFSSKDKNSLYLGMTLANGGELFLYHRELGHFNEMQARFYASQIFLALEYLHFMDLIYRDLKPENICLDENGYIKITDYGLAKYVPKRTQTICGTPEYISPEMIAMKPYKTSVDWWAFGILLYEFVAGRSPFSMHASDQMIMYEKISNANYKMPAKFSPGLRNLVSRLLQPNLSKRIGVGKNGRNDIKRHTWFKGVDWHAILNRKVPAPYIPCRKVRKAKLESKKLGLSKYPKRIENSEVFNSF